MEMARDACTQVGQFLVASVAVARLVRLRIWSVPISLFTSGDCHVLGLEQSFGLEQIAKRDNRLTPLDTNHFLPIFHLAVRNRVNDRFFSMDPDVEIMFVTKIEQLIPEQKTSIHVSREFCRHTLPEDDETSIETIWNNRLKENPRLFNGTKFRLHSVTSDSSGVFTMNIGLTDYREYLGTNWAPGVERLRALGQREFADSQAFLSDPMGVGAFVVTCDDHVIFLKRSLHCAEAPAMWDIPGGHAEPEVRNGKRALTGVVHWLVVSRLIR